jgi:hypothetical protein
MLITLSPVEQQPHWPFSKACHHTPGNAGSLPGIRDKASDCLVAQLVNLEP